MNHKIIIIIGVAVLAILALFMFNGPSSQSVSPNILYITQPVNSLSGKVEKIEGNAVFISSQYAVPQTAPIAITVMPNQPPVMPTPQVKTLAYKLLVTEKTQINQPSANVNYLFKTVTPLGVPGLPTASAPKLTVKNIKVGQYITVNSQVDFRTLVGSVFEATMINLPQIANTLNGKIVNVTNNTLTLKAFVPVTNPMGAVNTAPPAPQEKEYFITVTSGTEISRMTGVTMGESPTPPKPEKLTLSDLKKDIQITVYTAEDVAESQSLTALRIEPAQVISNNVPLAPEANAPIPPAPSPPIPSPSASASPSIKP